MSNIKVKKKAGGATEPCKEWTNVPGEHLSEKQPKRLVGKNLSEMHDVARCIVLDYKFKTEVSQRSKVTVEEFETSKDYQVFFFSWSGIIPLTQTITNFYVIRRDRGRFGTYFSRNRNSLDIAKGA